MTDTIDNLLLLEHLKRFQAGQDRIERKLDDVVGRIGQLEIGVAHLRRDFAHADQNVAVLNVRLDRMSDRIERIERRLAIA